MVLDNVLEKFDSTQPVHIGKWEKKNKHLVTCSTYQIILTFGYYQKTRALILSCYCSIHQSFEYMHVLLIISSRIIWVVWTIWQSTGGIGRYLFAMSNIIAKQVTKVNDAQNLENQKLGWMIGFRSIVSFLGYSHLCSFERNVLRVFLQSEEKWEQSDRQNINWIAEWKAKFFIWVCFQIMITD